MLEFAFQNNIDTIICDHHEPSNILPKAFAILNPLLPNCDYPFKTLAACGVTFKLIQAIATKINKLDIA
jgi:single-stranded-DNA-specific exonuclease